MESHGAHRARTRLLRALCSSSTRPSAFIDAPTGPRRLALIVEHGNEIYRRIGPLMPAVQSAASVDPDVAHAWQGLVDRRRHGMQRIVEDVFARRGDLRPGLDPAPALDLLFAFHRAEVFVAFTIECGWSIERFKAWQFVTLARAILPAADADAACALGSASVADLTFAPEVALFR